MNTSIRLKKALEHAAKVQDLYGLNVTGNSLALIEKALEWEGRRDEKDEEARDLSEVWMDYGADVIREDSQESSGHMSDRDIGVMEEECKELIEVVLEECSGIDEVREVLQAKEE